MVIVLARQLTYNLELSEPRPFFNAPNGFPKPLLMSLNSEKWWQEGVQSRETNGTSNASFLLKFSPQVICSRLFYKDSV